MNSIELLKSKTILVNIRFKKVDTKSVSTYNQLLSTPTPTLSPMFNIFSSATPATQPETTTATTDLKPGLKKDTVLVQTIETKTETEDESELQCHSTRNCEYSVNIWPPDAKFDCTDIKSPITDPSIKSAFNNQLLPVIANNCNMLFYGHSTLKIILELFEDKRINLENACNVHIYDPSYTNKVRFECGIHTKEYMQLLANLPRYLNVSIHTSDAFLKNDVVYNNYFHYIIGIFPSNLESSFDAIVSNTKLTDRRINNLISVQSTVVRFVTTESDVNILRRDHGLNLEYENHYFASDSYGPATWNEIQKQIPLVICAISTIIFMFGTMLYNAGLFTKQFGTVCLCIQMLVSFPLMMYADFNNPSSKRKFYKKINGNNGGTEPVNFTNNHTGNLVAIGSTIIILVSLIIGLFITESANFRAQNLSEIISDRGRTDFQIGRR